MIAVVQRVTQASVRVEDQVVGQIGPGLLVLVAIQPADGLDQVQWMARKLIGLRIFRGDGDKAFDRDVMQIGGGILLVSQFTLAGDARKGRRPSLDGAASPEVAREVFNTLVQAVSQSGVPVQTGQFQADMAVQSVNDGPVTFIISTDPPAVAGQ